MKPNLGLDLAAPPVIKILTLPQIGPTSGQAPSIKLIKLLVMDRFPEIPVHRI